MSTAASIAAQKGELETLLDGQRAELLGLVESLEARVNTNGGEKRGSTLEVECPAGVGPGDALSVDVGGGSTQEVVVPEGISEGDVFTVSIASSDSGTETHHELAARLESLEQTRDADGDSSGSADEVAAQIAELSTSTEASIAAVKQELVSVLEGMEALTEAEASSTARSEMVLRLDSLEAASVDSIARTDDLDAKVVAAVQQLDGVVAGAAATVETNGDSEAVAVATTALEEQVAELSMSTAASIAAQKGELETLLDGQRAAVDAALASASTASSMALAQLSSTSDLSISQLREELSSLTSAVMQRQQESKDSAESGAFAVDQAAFDKLQSDVKDSRASERRMMAAIDGMQERETVQSKQLTALAPANQPAANAAEMQSLRDEWQTGLSSGNAAMQSLRDECRQSAAEAVSALDELRQTCEENEQMIMTQQTAVGDATSSMIDLATRVDSVDEAWKAELQSCNTRLVDSLASVQQELRPVLDAQSGKHTRVTMAEEAIEMLKVGLTEHNQQISEMSATVSGCKSTLELAMGELQADAGEKFSSMRAQQEKIVQDLVPLIASDAQNVESLERLICLEEESSAVELRLADLPVSLEALRTQLTARLAETEKTLGDELGELTEKVILLERPEGRRGAVVQAAEIDPAIAAAMADLKMKLNDMEESSWSDMEEIQQRLSVCESAVAAAAQVPEPEESESLGESLGESLSESLGEALTMGADAEELKSIKTDIDTLKTKLTTALQNQIDKEMVASEIAIAVHASKSAVTAEMEEMRDQTENALEQMQREVSLSIETTAEKLKQRVDEVATKVDVAAAETKAAALNEKIAQMESMEAASMMESPKKSDKQGRSRRPSVFGGNKEMSEPAGGSRKLEPGAAVDAPPEARTSRAQQRTVELNVVKNEYVKSKAKMTFSCSDLDDLVSQVSQELQMYAICLAIVPNKKGDTVAPVMSIDELQAKTKVYVYPRSHPFGM